MTSKAAASEWIRNLRDMARPRVAVLRALKLGDLLCAVPALRALRMGLPGAEITLVGLPWAREFAARYSEYVDGFREFPGFPGLPEARPDLRCIPAFLQEMQGEQFDLAVQLHGSGSVVNPVIALFAARRTAGFYLPGEWCPDPDLFLPWPARGLEIRRLLSLTDHLGLPSKGERVAFPVYDSDVARWRQTEGIRDLHPGEYVCVHAGASVPERRWPPDQFAAVADLLAGFGLQIVLTGSAGERQVTQAVAGAMRAPAIDVAGRTDLGTVAALLQGARLLVSNDTGISHLGAAVGTPSVIISTGDNPQRWAPIDTRCHRVLCSPDGVSVTTVTNQVKELLNEVWPKARSPAHRGNEIPPPVPAGDLALAQG